MSKFIDTQAKEKDEQILIREYFEKMEKRSSDNRASKTIERMAQKPSAPVPAKDLDRAEKLKLRQEALAIVDELSLELDIVEEPNYKKPNTWMMYSVSELERGDAMQIDGAIYIYLKKLAWWRNKTANILVAQHHNPDAQKRVGELDYVYGFKSYVQHQQLERLGVKL